MSGQGGIVKARFGHSKCFSIYNNHGSIVRIGDIVGANIEAERGIVEGLECMGYFKVAEEIG